VNALTHDGKMYVVHATSPGGKTAAKDLRAIADSFRVG
jgi:NAD(P)H-nitrite reductase large subunit